MTRSKKCDEINKEGRLTAWENVLSSIVKNEEIYRKKASKHRNKNDPSEIFSSIFLIED